MGMNWLTYDDWKTIIEMEGGRCLLVSWQKGILPVVASSVILEGSSEKKACYTGTENVC